MQVKEVVAQFVEDDLEKKWLALSNEKWHEVVLEGIYQMMSLPTMEGSWKWCPDSTLKHLASDNGKTYLRMLKTLLLAYLSVSSTEPTSIYHLMMDHFFTLTLSDMKKPSFRTYLHWLQYSCTHCQIPRTPSHAHVMF